jgi:predicted DsbA family dithiol-disulfide isomerase
MPEHISVYYDYTCPYSYRVLHWLDAVAQSGRGVTVQWKAFSLKEVNRPAGEPSLFADATQGESVSILALEMAEAAQASGPDVFERYHQRVFEAMHAEHRRLAATDLVDLAREAGVDIASFEAARGRWLAALAGDHREAAERWHAFGTPTLIFQNDAAVYLKFTRAPTSPEDAAEVLDALLCLARCHPELVEIKYPQAI